MGGQSKSLIKPRTSKMVIIDFYADWCPPCRMIAPHLDQLVEENGGALAIYKVNVDHDHSEAIQTKNNIRVQSIPLFVGYKNGVEVGKVEGANKAKLAAMIAQNK